MNIRKNDMVAVIAGKDKGKRGRIFRIQPADDSVHVEGVNMVKRHMQPKPNVRQAGIIDREAPIHISNLKLVCPLCDKPTKALIRRAGATGKEKTRICKLCQAVIE